MSREDRERWNEKYRLKVGVTSPAPSEWLGEVVRGMAPGRAWDVACGAGQNALLLAGLGWRVDAVDVSPLGLEIGRSSSDGLAVNWIAADLDEYEPPVGVYDLVVVFRFLDRRRLPGLIEGSLKPGGRVVYETFVEGQLERLDNHLQNPVFVLNSWELPGLFPGLRTVEYREERLADRTVARWVGIRP